MRIDRQARPTRYTEADHARMRAADRAHAARLARAARNERLARLSVIALAVMIPFLLFYGVKS